MMDSPFVFMINTTSYIPPLPWYSTSYSQFHLNLSYKFLPLQKPIFNPSLPFLNDSHPKNHHGFRIKQSCPKKYTPSSAFYASSSSSRKRPFFVHLQQNHHQYELRYEPIPLRSQSGYASSHFDLAFFPAQGSPAKCGYCAEHCKYSLIVSTFLLRQSLLERDLYWLGTNLALNLSSQIHTIGNHPISQSLPNTPSTALTTNGNTIRRRSYRCLRYATSITLNGTINPRPIIAAKENDIKAILEKLSQALEVW